MTDLGAVDAIPPGTKVEVRSGFDASWSRGFEVIDSDDDGYRLRRLSDGMELPVRFADTTIRPERKMTNDMWWY